MGDIAKVVSAIDSIASDGLPIRIIFDEGSIMKIALAVIVASLTVKLVSKYLIK